MNKRILLLTIGVMAMLYANSQFSLPEEYSLIFEGAPIMGAKTYEAKKKQVADSLTIVAFIPCDNAYYLFRKQGTMEYELLYPLGDYVMILSAVQYEDGAAYQHVRQFDMRKADDLQALDDLLCFTYCIRNPDWR